MEVVAVLMLILWTTVQSSDVESEAKTYTFLQSQSFIEIRPWWPLREKRQLSFSFRTQLAHGLLVHHGILSQPNDLGYDLYIKLEKGQLRIIHIFNNDVNSHFVGQGLSNDVWHGVRLTVDPSNGNITIVLDGRAKSFTPKSLKNDPNYGLKGDTVQTVLFFGGLNPNDTIWARQYGYEQFIGCLGDISLRVNGTDVAKRMTYSHAQIRHGCIDRCYTDDLCLHGSLCVNHYHSISCDCFGTHHEGRVCGSDDVSTITLHGYSYVSYKIYDWVDKVHSDYTRMSLTFRTSFDDSVLFYGFGETPTRNYVAASLVNGSVHVTVDFGDGPLEVTLGSHLHNDWWHTLTILHTGNKVRVGLDGVSHPNHSLEVSGRHHLHLDPRFYVGGVPIKAPKYGLKTINNFVGSMREAYFGTVSILHRLRSKDNVAEYHGLFPPHYGYESVEVLPVTFFYPESKIRLTSDRLDRLSLRLDFKTNYSMAVLAHSAHTNNDSVGYWQLGLENGAAIVSVVVGPSKNLSIYPVKIGRNLNDGKWHNVEVVITGGIIGLAVDYRQQKEEAARTPVLFSAKIYVGGSMEHPEAGFVGCMRQIELNSVYMDPRNVIDSDQIEGGEISMDNCQLVDPCARPGVCEHGGKCHMRNKTVVCDCTGTGYRGNTCHFSEYRRTCEELFLVGYRRPDDYMIDIDGNGPHPPAYVYCDMANEMTTTSIVTNLPSELVVRKSGIQSFQMAVTYRNFTADMLQTLIRHSKNCTQSIRFECFKAPLGLRTYTWFRTSYKNSYLSSFGSVVDSNCKCGDVGNCSNPRLRCNCDAEDQRWRADEAELHDPEHLGITEMFFLQPENLPNDAEGRITLGPLKCLEMDTQQYEITFKTAESYLEIPGWKTGDLAFSFRTSHKQAILFYQPALYSTHSHFKIFLVNENELSFEFSVRGEPKIVIVRSQTPLNSGEWQQVWVDYDKHHVRFTINTYFKMIDLEKNEEFGLFEGTLYVGGAPQEYLNESSIKAGFVGCLRGLVVNEEVSNLFAYLSPRTPQIVIGCKPSCDPNPCKNGATCNEFWGTFTCECANRYAHSGKLCEQNINENGVTFVTENGHFHQLYQPDEQPPFLTGDILANIRTYVSKGLILYAHDHYFNFVQLHIMDGKLVFTYNSNRQLVRGFVEYEGLSRGIPVQIFVDREPDKTILRVNDEQTIIPHPLRLVDTYRQNPWVSGMELELIKPPRPPVETQAYSQIFLGALDRGSNMEFTLPGFVGCLTGLRIGTSVVDLMRMVDENPGTENFRKGCRMSCDSVPCKNGGYCIEDWRNRQHHCDCGLTSYMGKFCQDDIGGSFDGSTFIKHTFAPDASTYQVVKVQLSFLTNASFDSPAVILFVNSKVDERNYILVALKENGQLLFEEDDGSRRVIHSLLESTSGTFKDGRRHWIFYHRNRDNIKYMVDNKVIPMTRKQDDGTPVESEPPRYGGESTDTVMVGGMEFIDERFANYIKYKGCLSNVNISIDSYNIYPLESAYRIRPAGETLKVIGHVKKMACASLNSAYPFNISATDHQNKTRLPEWRPIYPVMVPYNFRKLANHELEDQIADATTKRVGLILGICLLILIIAVGIYLWRLDWKDKQYRYEEYDGDGGNCMQKQQRLVEKNFKVYGRGDDGLFYYDPGDMILSRDDSSYPYIGDIIAEKIHFLNEDPNSEADTKTVDDSEDNADHVSDDVDGFKNTSSQDLDWDPSADSADIAPSEESVRDKISEDLETSVDDLVEPSDGELEDGDFRLLPTPRSVVRAPLSTVSEASTEMEHEPVSEKALKGRTEEDLSAMEGRPSLESSAQPALTTGVVLRRPQRVAVGPQPAPVFLPNNQRAFANPISYLGGPRIGQSPSKRDSIESVISLD